MIIVTPSCSKSSVFKNVSPSLKSIFEKPCFRVRLVRTVGLTAEKKLRFQISPAYCRAASAREDEVRCTCTVSAALN